MMCHFVMTTTFSETQEGICPTVVPCFCQRDQSVSCSYQSLKELPDFLEFTEVWKELDLSENFLLVLHDNGFNGVKVKSLRLERNMLRLIEQGSFNGLSMLESLDLSHNSLTSIPSRIFKDVPMLHTLRFKYNALHTIGEESLAGLSGLHELDCIGNLFHSVPTSSSLCKAPKLKKLLLRHNKIQKLKPYTFYGLSLDYLDIGANEAPMIIEADAFCGLDPQVLSSEPGVIDYTGLSTLRLDLNGLTTLSSCLTQRMWTLSSLDISGNPLHCDCSLLLLKMNGAKTAAKTTYPGAQCAGPDQYAGQYLKDIIPHTNHCSTQGHNNTKSCQTSMCKSNKPQNIGCTNRANILYWSRVWSIFVTVVCACL